jgi:hypothetical protein
VAVLGPGVLNVSIALIVVFWTEYARVVRSATLVLREQAYVSAARALGAAYATVTSGELADLVATLQGVLVTRPWQIPELEWSYAGAAGGIVGTADVVLAAAAGAGLRRYLTSLQLKNAGTVATEVVVRDGVTVIWHGHLGAAMGATETHVFADPLRSSPNAALNLASLTARTQVHTDAQDFTAA